MAETVTSAANEVAAPLVREAGELTLEIRSIRHWAGGQGSRMQMTLAQRHRDGATNLSELGAGLRLWSSVALLEATGAQGFQAGTLSFDQPETFQRVLLIVDEPERHLHPRAQAQLAMWLAEHTERDLLVATHSVPFLNIPTDDASVALVTRDSTGVTLATDITDDTFGYLDAFTADAGLSSAAEALQVLQGIILVEGAHDERVIEHFFGNELARERILIVPVRGARNVDAIVDAPWLSRYNAPLVVLFDDVQASEATGRKRPKSSIAARAIWDLRKHWRQTRPRPAVVSFSHPDILRAIPEPCMTRAVERMGGTFPGWDSIDRSFSNSKAGFKKVLLGACRLPSDADNALLDAVLTVCRRDPTRSWLTRSGRHATVYAAGERLTP